MASATPVNRFIEAFLLPIVAGGRVQVRGLIGPGMLAHYVADRELDGTLVAQVTTHMHAQLARIGPVGSVDLLPADAIALAAVWHNLLAMTHPESVKRVRLRRRVRAWTERMLAWIGPPRTAAEVAGRHAVLARLGEIGRVDTDVAFWAGSARYVGVAPPPRLLAWRSIRRVRENKIRVPFYDLLALLAHERHDADLLEPALIALSYSPLTDIALLDRPAPARFAWTRGTVNVLGDLALRGAITRMVLTRPGGGVERGEQGSSRVRAVEAATRAAVQQDGVPPAVAHMLLALHLELLATDALGRGAPPNGHALGWDIVARLGLARAAAITGVDAARLEHALGLTQRAREAHKDAPAAALIARAGLASEVPS